MSKIERWVRGVREWLRETPAAVVVDIAAAREAQRQATDAAARAVEADERAELERARVAENHAQVVRDIERYGWSIPPSERAAPFRAFSPRFNADLSDPTDSRTWRPSSPDLEFRDCKQVSESGIRELTDDDFKTVADLDAERGRVAAANDRRGWHGKDDPATWGGPFAKVIKR
jgi:hypothetical protein